MNYELSIINYQFYLYFIKFEFLSNKNPSLVIKILIKNPEFRKKYEKEVNFSALKLCI